MPKMFLNLYLKNKCSKDFTVKPLIYPPLLGFLYRCCKSKGFFFSFEENLC